MNSQQRLTKGLILFGMIILGSIIFNSNNNIGENQEQISVLEKIIPKNQGVILEWGSYGARNNELNNPMGITITDQDLIYISDTQNNRINIYDTNGLFQSSWGSYGAAFSQFNAPEGIAFDKLNNYIYVSDTKNKRVQVFNATSKGIVNVFGIDGEPSGIAVDSTGNVFIADKTLNLIRKFSSGGVDELNHWGSINGQPSSSDGRFDNPVSIAIDSSNNIYVSDMGNNRIQKFDNNGNFISKFGTQGSTTGQFQNPAGIFISANNLLYVTEFWGHRVQVFDLSGNFNNTWGSQGNSRGSLFNPSGIVVDIHGFAYVLEFGNNRVQKFYTNSDFKTYPADLVIDAEDNIYYLDSNLATILKINGTSKSPILKIGDRGVEDGKFITPVAIEKDALGDIYVLDSSNAKISKFSNNGSFLLGIGGSTIFDGKNMKIPQDFAIDSVGNIYIADSGNHRIIILNSTGGFTKNFGQFGYENGQFNRPIAITVSDDAIIVLDETGRMQKFNVNGDFLLKSGSVGTGVGQFGFPSKIITDDSSNLYVVNTFSNRIQKYDAAINHLLSWGYIGTNLGQLKSPSGIGLLSNGKLVIADTGNFRLQIFSSDGTPESSFKLGSASSSLKMMPYGAVYVDSTKQIYITDWLSDCIRIFDINGNLNKTIGTSGTGSLQFDSPLGITYDSQTKNIYVVDSGNDRVVVLKDDQQIASFDYSSGGGFNAPNDVAINSSGYIYISDTGTNRVIVFNSTYDAQFVISGLFNQPKGLFIDENNKLFVADANNHRILKLNESGEYLMAFGNQFGSDDGEFAYPLDITKNSQNQFIITDSSNHRIVILNNTGGFVDSFGRYGTSQGRFQVPSQISYINNETLAITDWGNGRIQIMNEANLGEFTSPVLNPIESPDGDGNYTLTWNAIVDAEFYLVYRSTHEHINEDNVRYLEPIAIISDTMYFESNMPNGTYYYAIAAGNSQQNTSVSNSIQVIVAIEYVEPEDKIGIPLDLSFFVAVFIGVWIIKKKSKI